MYLLHFFVTVLCVSVRKCVGYSKLLWPKDTASRVLAWARWQTSAMDEIPTRQCRAPDFSKWFVTDFCWPHDEERAAQLGRNSDYLRQRGVQVVADSVDVMNIFPFLRNHEINANDVALVVIHGMCSRVGTDDNAYRATQALLRVPPGDGPITCAFGALAAALPQATVVVSATGSRKVQSVAQARVTQRMTRPVLCRTIAFPASEGIQYRPEANGPTPHMLDDATPLALVAVGSCFSSEEDFFGRTELQMGPLVAHAAATDRVILFCGEFTCTHSVHMLTYCQSHPVMPRSLGRWLEAETMKWNDEDRSYSYEETVAHAEQALRAKSEDTTYVGMHAANLWVYKARGLQTTNMRAGDAWFPTGDGLI